jgi:DNA-binding transcriptional LysR family regulator
MDINLFGLRIFVMVAEKQSFSEAARSLYLTQPAVTHQIKNLENYYGAPLFKRESNTVLLTPVGQILYKYAKRFAKLDDELMAEIENSTGRLRGDLVIGACTMVGGHLIPDLVKEFCETHPEVNFSIDIGNCPAVIDKLLKGTIDVGLIGDKAAHRDLAVEELLEHTLFLVSSPDYVSVDGGAVSLKDLTEMKLLLREVGVGTRVRFEALISQHGMNLRNFQIITVSGSDEVIKMMVKNGVGVSFLPRKAIERELEIGDLKKLALQEGELRHKFYLVYRKQKVLSLKTKNFLEFVRGQAGDNGFLQESL